MDTDKAALLVKIAGTIGSSLPDALDLLVAVADKVEILSTVAPYFNFKVPTELLVKWCTSPAVRALTLGQIGALFTCYRDVLSLGGAFR
mmetsp:Transcript_23730/g.58163  ORF Transcript_23730/g.58163 Transcript_23730/m.58163 type:complete len:89 (-) Transcript_23730:554-820(-)